MATASIEQTKQDELARALQLAGNEQIAGVTLAPHDQPIQGAHAGEIQHGFLVQSNDPDIMHADVVIFSEVGSDIIQFGFPEDMQKTDGLAEFAPELAVSDSGAYTLGFFPAIPASGGNTRGAIKKWIAHAALKIARKEATKAIEEIARLAEKEAKPTTGFIAMESGYKQIANAQQMGRSEQKRVLLFVHGIFSSIEGGFHALGEPGGNSTLQQLLNRYGNNVFGYDHWTISKTPSENAIDLLKAIPEGANWTVDVVSHSRGGLITRTLFANPNDQHLPQTEDLRQIAALRQGKIANVGDVIFVAGANQGSPLAEKETLKKFLKVAGVLASKSQCFALDVVIGLLRTLLSAAYSLPSIEQLDSNSSQLITDLNKMGSIVAGDDIYGVRANFDRAGWSWKEAAALMEHWLMPEPNDLVVPYAGVVANPPIPDDEPRMRDFARNGSQSAVWHTNYFEQPETHDFLLQHLTG